MAGKRNINRLRKAMNNNSVSSTVKKTADTVKKAAQSTAVSTAVKSGASAARQAAHSSSQYNGESQRSVIKSGEKQRRLQELSKKNEKLEQNNTFLSGMKKYTDKNARLKGSSGKQVTAKELQQATKDIQKETVKKGKGKKLSDDKLVNLTKGNLRQTAGSHMKTVGTTAQNSAGNIVPASAGSTASALIGSKYRKQVEESRKTAQKEGGKMISKKGTEQIDKGSKEIEKGTKGLGKAGKFAADVYGAGLGMATDAFAGPMSLGAMFSRSYGSAYDTAEKEGADPLQATLYGAGIGGIEAGTEKMFAVAKPLKKLYGAGMGDDIAEALLNKIVKKTSSKSGKNLAYHGGKVTLSALSEGLEEMVSEGLEPAVANKIYAEATGTPHSTTVKDVLYSGAVGGAMGGILGGAGQVVEYGQGRRVQNVFGEDGVKALAKAAKEVDDAGAAVKGSAINEMINRGEGIAAGQANELYKAVYEQEIKDLERNDIVNRSAERIMKRENLISPVTVDSRTGEMMVGKKTMESYTAQKAEAEKAINELSKEETDLSLPDLTKDQIASAVAAVQTGVAGVDEINLFTTGNPQARAVYESVTGKTLPKTNAGTREMLYRESGMNRVESARAETKSRVDEVKGLIAQDMGKYYESAGQEAFSQAFGDVNIGNAAQVDDMINTFDDFYRAGRNDIGYDTVISYQNPVHGNVSSEVKKAAWEAGQQDKILATETAKGLQMKIGETAKKNRSQRKMSAYKGRLYSELSNENKAKFTASQQTMLRALARVFNIDIHIVDAVENGANGYYKDGKMYISMEADRALEYVFAHEITHHMQQYAPEEYNELKELVRESWAQQGGIDEAVDFKVAQYAQHGVELNREDALDEILADSTYEVLQDETFVEELCRENRSIAQSILNAIKDVLKKLRSLLADGDRFTPAQNAQLLSNLDILKEFEKKWTDGLLRSVENRDAVMRSGVDAVKYSKKNDNSTIKEQLRENLNKLADMKPVADVKYESIKHLNRSEKAKAIMSEYNKKFKGGVERRGFGFIVLREDEVTGSLKYLYTDGEFAAFKTLPQVLKRGEIIEGHTNHKGRAVNTITIAAPVTINGTTGYMAAAVKTGGKNRYHVHRILMPDGSEFEFNKKTEPTGAGVPIENDSKGSAISSVSENSVTPADGKSNGKFSLGYHAGDLGKSESLASQSGGRSTGHFGTGTYFVGNKEKLKNYNKRDGEEAPIETVDFDEYNLYKPKDTKAAHKLHDFLKGVNEYYNSYGFGTLDEDGVQEIMSRADDLLYDLQENDAADTEARMFLESVTREDFSEDSKEDLENALYNLTDDRSREIAKLERVAAFNEDIPEMSKALGISKKELIEKIADIKSELKDVRDFRSRSVHDSASTMLMKSLGYEGIDVRHTDLDNTAYGSVIYDLKGKDADRKAEIGTARFSLKDSDGREFSEAQQEYFKDSKIRDEDGNLLVVYHGSSESFNTFDRTKARANMDIQGNFFSPWEIDAGGYGENVRAFYLNINNPASSGVAYSALNKFKGQNNAGVKAREYLESQGYDGVNNDGEEYIAFYPKQIKSVDNSNPTSDPDIRYSMKESFSNQVDGALAGTLDRNNHVFVCETPQILRAVGLNDLPMLMTQKHIRNINKGADGSRKHYHGISRDVIKKIPQYLQEPVAIMDSLSTATQPGVVVLTEEVDSEGRPIVIAIKPDGQGFYDVDLDSNFILSMYGRNNFEKFLEDNVKESTFLYISNKKSKALFEKVRLQSPQSLESFALDAIIRKSDNLVNDAEREKYSVSVEDYVRFSLKNENLSPDAKIPYTVHQSYISVKKNDNAALKNLQDNVRKLKRGTYENKATGYKADINGRTVGKILNPSHNMKHAQWSKKYIENLNAAAYLPELFENAVYVDTKENQKSKKANQQIQGYHHFVAPIYMDDKEYRVRIVAREKQNSDTLYIVETEIMTIKDGVRKLPGQKPRNLGATPSDISIPELVNGVKIYDYNMQKNDIYNHNDIKYSMPDETSVIDYMNEQEAEFADLTGFRDYEVKAKQVRQQTYGELVAQVEKLKNDKMFTKGKVLNERSVREEINDMIVTLMSYSESYNSLGVRKKTDHNLVREGVNAAKQIFTAMKKGDVSDVVTKAELAAQQIVENLKLVEDTAYVEYKDLRDYLRTTRMVISEEDAADIPDFKQFKKSNFGRIRIVSQNGIPVDTAYQELMERYPELFSDEITHPADMLRAIADVRESLEPYDIMLSAEETEQLVKQTAQDLIDIAATGKAWKSWADKKKEQYDEKLKMLKQRQQEALRDVKKKERDRAEKKLEKERQKGKERLEKAKDKARAKSEEKLQAERQKGKERLDKAKEKNAEKLQREKDKAKEKAERQKDSKERKRLLAGIEQNRKWLSDRLSKPTDDKHIPEGFRTALADLLSKIDMQSQKSKALEEKTGQRARRWVEMDELKVV